MRPLIILFATVILCASAAASSLVPTVPNSGFESGVDGWAWYTMGGAQVGFSLDARDPHSGKSCVMFSNASGVAPNVYGRLHTNVNVLQSTRYELSCWARGEDVSGEGGATHFTDWSTYTLNLPTGDFGWKKVSVEFTTHAGQTVLNLGINIVNKCKTLAIDDIVLRPLGGQINGDNITGVILANPRVIGNNTPAPIAAVIENSNDRAAGVDAYLTIGERKVSFRRRAARPGENTFQWYWNTGKTPFGKYECTVRVLDRKGTALASGSTTIEVADSPILHDLASVEARKKEFDALYKRCEAKGIRLDYPAAAKVMLEQFIPLAHKDLRQGFEWRAQIAIPDFNRSLDEGIATMKAYLADPELAPIVKRYKTGRVDIDGLSFIGDRVDSNGKKDHGPLFFCGYGHFYQARKDIPLWPSYGVNIIQASEFGPSAIFPEEGKVDLTQAKTLVRTLDEAAKHNVKVDFLISPHYFPEWVLNKYPHLRKGGGGFFGLCVDDPVAKDIMEKFLRLVVPMIKDKPALHSFCLSNEPVFPNIAGCDNTKQMWLDYLARTHGTIETLNERYGMAETETGHYKSFDEVPYSGDPQAYDWIVFDQQRFANWHRWLADIIHEMAPNVPTHAKVMSNQLNAGAVTWATDQELFGNLLELNGNDCYIFPTGNPAWPLDPWLQNTSYDIQRSFARKPVFNSENHITPDNSTYYIAPEHFRTALWQGAIHGQGATTIWVWEHDYSGSCLTGNVMDRPGSAQAVGTTCLDLNRFAEEVTALQNVKAPVAIVYSMSSIIRRGGEHAGSVLRAYQGLSFRGIPIDFISEKQLAAGKASQYRMIIVPEAETLTDAAFDAIRALPTSTRLLVMNQCFTRNEYGRKRDPQLVKEVTNRAVAIKDGDPEKVVWPELLKQLEAVYALPDYQVVDAKTGEPIWGVEWLPARLNGRTVISLLNYTNTPHEIKILRRGIPVQARDLLSLGGAEKVSTVKLLTPVLAEVDRR